MYQALTGLRLDEPSRTISVRIPERVSDLIDEIASRTLRSRSDVMRLLMISKLVDTGHIAEFPHGDLKIKI